jgi:Domain of unknown function (DUF4349)
MNGIPFHLLLSGEFSMTFTWLRAALFAALIFAALFVFRFVTHAEIGRPFNDGFAGEQAQSSFENARKNYASSKTVQAKPAASAIGDGQKYEKIASLTETTADFEADKARMTELIAANKSVVQLERATGLKGFRLLHLGIGVPPEKFDAFVEAAKGIGRNIQIEIIKNDKTNEYLQLRAKRTTLEKARTSLEELKSSGGSIEERVSVQNRLMEIEEKIQDLGVSLGEFDPENELCTVKFTLREKAAATPQSTVFRIYDALEWSAWYFVAMGAGFFGLVVGAWLAVGLAGYVQRLVSQARSS